MNCKAGDLAFVVNAATEENIGKVVLVEYYLGNLIAGEFVDCPNGLTLVSYTGHQWWVTGSGLRNNVGSHPGVVIRDSCLRPIRDPGDDARDETLDWLPVPKRKEPEVWTPKRQVENA